ncbi:hypothetical protein FACS1894111_13110 [Clostridia bacterium]|nr:hypothetical protein FACS1894111_13110 [Clostridia bacterium]
MEQILSDNGAPEERMERFDEIYEEIMPKDSPILAANVVNAKKCELKMPNITVSVKAECTHLLETKLIDGRNCLVIALEDRVEVNGIPLYDGAESRV